MYLLLVVSLNDFQLKLRECGEAHEHPQELHFNDVHPGPMGIHETERLIRGTLCLHFCDPMILQIAWNLHWTVAFCGMTWIHISISTFQKKSWDDDKIDINITILMG